MPVNAALRTASFLLLILFALAPPIAAQPQEPIPAFAADLHGVFARHKSEPSVATDLGVTAGNLPSHSFGLAGGGHVYVLRGHKVTFGFGGTLLVAGGSNTIEPTSSSGTPGSSGSTTPGATVRRHFRSINPEISLNFGHKNGWSYISGGFGGRSRLYVDREDLPATDVPSRSTLTYGAGARWFASEHVAFSVEVRWYSIAEQPASRANNVVLEPRTTLMVLSGGISIK